MPFLRQLYKQKPQAWGPVSSVQASIFKNAERIGIDPASIALAMPMWGPWNQLDYSKNNRIFTPGSGVTFSKNSLKTTNDANGVIDLGSTFSPNNVNNFTVIQSCKINTIDSFSLSSRTSSLTGGFEFLIGGASTYGNVNLRYTDAEAAKTSATATGLNDGRYHQLTALLDSTNNTATFMVDSNIIGASLVIFGSITNTQNLFIDKRGTTYRAGDHNYLWIASAIWTTSQIAYLSDNPYFLLYRVAPVFYSVPGGAGGVTISSTIGTVVVTGYDVGIETGVTISVNTGIITGTGFNVEVKQGTSVQVTTGEISINGLNPDIVQGIQFIVTKGMVTINSFDTTVLNGTEINVTSKNVSITGYAVEVEQGIIITSSIESIIITGYNVSVTNELVISLNVGSVIIAGYNTTVLAGMKIDLTKAEITITGLDLEIEQGTQIDVTSETVTVTGLDVSVENALSIKVTTGSVNVFGYPVNVYAGILVEATTGNVAITGYNPTVAQSSGVEVTTGQVTITGLDTTIECTVLIEPTTGMVIIASYGVIVTDGLVAETPITRTNVVAASNRIITNSGSSRLMTNSNFSRLIVIT